MFLKVLFESCDADWLKEELVEVLEDPGERKWEESHTLAREEVKTDDEDCGPKQVAEGVRSKEDETSIRPGTAVVWYQFVKPVNTPVEEEGHQKFLGDVEFTGEKPV